MSQDALSCTVCCKFFWKRSPLVALLLESVSLCAFLCFMCGHLPRCCIAEAGNAEVRLDRVQAKAAQGQAFSPR